MEMTLIFHTFPRGMWKLAHRFCSRVMVYVVETATQVLHEGRTRCLPAWDDQKPAHSSRHFRPLQRNQGSTDGTHPHTYRLAGLARCDGERLESTGMGPERGLHKQYTLRAIVTVRACKEGGCTLLGSAVTFAGRWPRRGGPEDCRNTTE